MKWRWAFPAWLFLLTLCVSASAEEMITLGSFSSNDGGVMNIWENRVSFEKLSKTPSWNAEETLPPLDMKSALKIAREYLKKNQKEHTAFGLSDIRLEQCISPKYIPNKWFYGMTIIKTKEGSPLPEFLQISIMMDGTVVEPILAKQINVNKTAH